MRWTITAVATRRNPLGLDEPVATVECVPDEGEPFTIEANALGEHSEVLKSIPVLVKREMQIRALKDSLIGASGDVE